MPEAKLTAPSLSIHTEAQAGARDIMWGTCLSPPHLHSCFHSSKPSVLIAPPTWKIISGECKMHSCTLLTRTLTSWKERTSIAQISKHRGRQKREIIVSRPEDRVTQEMGKPKAYLTVLKNWPLYYLFFKLHKDIPTIAFSKLLFLFKSTF